MSGRPQLHSQVQVGAECRAAPKPARIPSGDKHAYSRGRGQGFTLLEAAFVIAVIAILLSVAMPNFTDYLARQRLRHVAELLEQDLRRARTLSVEEGRSVTISFQSGPQWCWGSTRSAACGCASGAPRCELGGVDARDYKQTLLQTGQSVTFEGGMGRAVGWTRIGLSNTRNQQLFIDLSPVGRPQICGPDARRSENC